MPPIEIPCDTASAVSTSFPDDELLLLLLLLVSTASVPTVVASSVAVAMNVVRCVTASMSRSEIVGSAAPGSTSQVPLAEEGQAGAEFEGV